MTGWVLDVGVLFAELERRRVLGGLSLAEVAAAARVPVSALDGMAAGVVPSVHDAGSLLLWLGWFPDMAQLVVGDPS